MSNYQTIMKKCTLHKVVLSLSFFFSHCLVYGLSMTEGFAGAVFLRVNIQFENKGIVCCVILVL